MVDFHDERGGLATLALKAVDNPLEFGIVITRRGRLDRAVPREADLGPGLQRHHQHRDLRARAGDLRLHPRGPARRLLRRVVPGRPGRRQAALRLRGRRLLGGRRAPSRPTSRPTRTSSTSGCRSTSTGFQLRPGVWLGKGAEIDPSVELDGPAVIGDNCVIGPGARLGRVLHPRPQRPDRRQRRSSSGRWSTTTPTSGPGSGIDGSVLGRGSRPAPGRPLRGGRRARRRVLRRCPRRDQGRREDLPVQDGRGGRHRQLVDRLGVDGAPGRSSGGTASGAWPTWTSAPSWPCASRWPGRRPSRRGPPSPPRGTPAGPPGCSSGRSWSAATRPASTSTTSRRPPSR